MKTGGKIVITKTGKFEGLTGEIISNNELADKPLTVDLNPYGVWSFKLTDVSTKVVSPFDPEIIKGASELYDKVKKAKVKKDAGLKKPKSNKRGTYKPRKPKTI